MEPRIQYAKTKDGVSIAYWTLGEGMPFVGMPYPFSHIQREWQMPESRRWYERMVREALKAHGGSEVKTLGDGFMTSFSSATKALECAIAMQRAFAAHNESAQQPILVRIGLNAGEPIAEDDDLYGTAVNEAARITATAKGGEILVSNVVRELVKGKDILFSDRGEVSLKGFDEPVRLYEVRWRGE